MSNIRMLNKNDINAYERLIKKGYVEAELQGIHYSAFRKSREELLRWLAQVPTWGLFNDNGLLIAGLSLQFAWHREKRIENIIFMKHVAVMPCYKDSGYFTKLFSWVENNILRRTLRANAVYIETSTKFSKFELLYIKRLDFCISDKYKGDNGCVVIEKHYDYDHVPEAIDYNDDYNHLDMKVSMLTEKHAKEYCLLLHEGSKSSRAEGIDFSFGHMTEAECRKWLIEVPTCGIFSREGKLISVGSLEFPWQTTCTSKTRRHPLTRQATVLASYYKQLIKEKRINYYKNNIFYKYLNKGRNKFSLHMLIWDYLIGFYLVEMLRCPIVYSDVAYKSQAMNIEINEWGFKITEHIYSYSSTPHAVILQRNFVYE